MIKYHKDIIASHTPEELGINYDAHHRLLTNEPVSMKTLLKIMNTLDVSLRELIYYEKD